MIIIEMNGGLGNQLQQYVLYEKFISLGKDVRLDTSWYQSAEKPGAEEVTKRNLELDYFPNVSYRVCTLQEKQDILGSSSFFSRTMRKLGFADSGRYSEHRMYDEDIFQMENKVLSGYWACEAYYAGIMDVLREKLIFPPSDNPLNKEMKTQMEKHNSVSIHLRRGDYLTGENQKMFGGICTDEYYRAAVRYIRERVEEPHFYVFSDDPEYAAEYFSQLTNTKATTYTAINISKATDIEKTAHNTATNTLKATNRDKTAHNTATNTSKSTDIEKTAHTTAINISESANREKPANSAAYTIVDINHGKDSFYDIELMSRCKHNICANSTFSFWGARLNSYPYRIAIRPLKQKNGVDWYQPEEMKRLWRGWICMDEQGRKCT